MVEWEIIEVEDLVAGPPKPLACVDGPFSHVWTFDIYEGGFGLTCDCRLCVDGFDSVDRDMFGGEFPVRLALHREAGQPMYGIDPEVWIEIMPADAAAYARGGRP